MSGILCAMAGTSSASPASLFYFGPEYGNWNGERIIFSTTSNGSGTTSFNGLDGTLDSSTGRLYDAYMGNGSHAYRTGGYYTWGTNIVLPNRASTDGRSSTIGYYNGTAYLYMGNTDKTVDIYLLSNLSYVATWTISNFVGQVGGLAYDGKGNIYAIDIGATTTLYRINTTQPITQSISATNVVTLGRAVQFGLLFNGTTVIARSTPGATVTEFNISNGAIVNTYTAAGTSGYGIHIDYVNKNLYTGGLSDTGMRRFPGS